MAKLSIREKLILAGLFLSKFDQKGLSELGFSNFAGAFNTLALSLKANPASLKNYRDEFDPYFANPRKGWHKRKIRVYCKELMDEYGSLDIASFSKLIKTQFSDAEDLELIKEQTFDPDSSFAKRMLTGQAAEKYFEKVYQSVPQFTGHKLVNTTHMGCGFDYKLNPAKESCFLAVEVKGMATSTGMIQFTSKEYDVARHLGDRFFLFIVRNFWEKPFYSLFPDPLNSSLAFDRHESTVVRVTYSTPIQGD